MATSSRRSQRTQIEASNTQEVTEALQVLEQEIANYRFKDFHADRLPGLLQDHDAIAALIRKGMTHMTDIACELELLHEKEAAGPLDENFRALIDVQNKLGIQKKIFGGLETRIRQGRVSDPVKEYESQWATEESAYQKKSAKLKYYNDSSYRDFVQNVWNIHHSKEPMPPLGQDDDDDDDDDDVVVGQTRMSLKCPLTTTWLEEPMTSKVCRHTFSKAALFQLIQRNGGRIECPVAGCKTIVGCDTFFHDALVERAVIRAQSMEDTELDYYDVE